MEKNQLIETIVEKEWRQFTIVNNQGGRASCQDDRSTFDIMRKSQFLAWNNELLESYFQDLEQSENSGWSLLAEKYARMMVSTDPVEYERIKGQLPHRSEERVTKQEEIVMLQVLWLEEIYQKYPRLEGSGRPVRTWQDTPWATSFETYLRGELGSYSDKTIALYIKMVEEMKQQGQNLAEITLENTAQLYGYKDLQGFK